jgi:hypothetical protein
LFHFLFPPSGNAATIIDFSFKPQMAMCIGSSANCQSTASSNMVEQNSQGKPTTGTNLAGAVSI